VTVDRANHIEKGRALNFLRLTGSGFGADARKRLTFTPTRPFVSSTLSTAPCEKVMQRDD
jgi:hypothetical protein